MTWFLSQLDLRDRINEDIWRDSLAVQARLCARFAGGASGLQQARVDGAPVPWVPDLVGMRWREPSSLVVVGSAYAPFLEGASGRRRTLPLAGYRAASTAADFLRVFVDQVVSGDSAYYGPVGRLLRGVVQGVDRAVVMDLVRASLVRTVDGKGGDDAAEADPEFFLACARAGWTWTWRRLQDSRAEDVVVLGHLAERGLQTLMREAGLTVEQAPDRPYWVVSEPAFFRPRRWRVFPVAHPARHNVFDRDYTRALANLRGARDKPRTAWIPPSAPRAPSGHGWGQRSGPGPTQRDVMRQVWRLHGPDEEAAILAYADAEREGVAPRLSNVRGESPEEYARRLLYDGIKKGWL